MNKAIFTIDRGDGPLVATAIHDGHEIRDELVPCLAIGNAARLQEEDPYTFDWTQVAGVRVAGLRSRFEVDLNRDRSKAVYLKPEDAWGLQVWKAPLPAEMIERSLAEFDAFYDEMGRLFQELESEFDRFVVFDLHTYNHRREGASAAPANPELNPEVNIGTGSMDRAFWGPLVDRFMGDLRAFDFLGRHLDVRENVKFTGGRLSRFVHGEFPGTGCALAIEFKKFFMDEWTGKLDEAQHAAIAEALRSTVPGVLQELERLR